MITKRLNTSNLSVNRPTHRRTQRRVRIPRTRTVHRNQRLDLAVLDVERVQSVRPENRKPADGYRGRVLEVETWKGGNCVRGGNRGR